MEFKDSITQLEFIKNILQLYFPEKFQLMDAKNYKYSLKFKLYCLW